MYDQLLFGSICKYLTNFLALKNGASYARRRKHPKSHPDISYLLFVFLSLEGFFILSIFYSGVDMPSDMIETGRN